MMYMGSLLEEKRKKHKNKKLCDSCGRRTTRETNMHGDLLCPNCSGKRDKKGQLKLKSISSYNFR